MASGQAADIVPAGIQGASQALPQLRLAVISSPRSGNTWLREMIAALYGLEQIPVHFPEDIPWENLPNRCIIQIHWNPEPDFTARLERHGIRVLVIARHVFDVLMSYLNYVYYVHQEGICPGGGACEECVIVGQTPQSQAFRDYVASERAALLFGYTPRWWNRPEVIRFRYEDLVADTETHLRNFVHQLGESPIRPIAEVIEKNSIRQMKPNRDVWQYHFWQGRPGLWRSMIPKAEAEWLAEHRPEFFETIGYAADADPSLEPLQAELNWLQLQLNSTREHLGLERAKHRKALAESKDLKAHLKVTERGLAEKDDVYAGTHAELLRYRQCYLDSQDQLLGKGRELDAAIQRLDATYQELDSTHHELERTRRELRTSRQELQTTNDELHATSHELAETRQRLVPLDEIGPRGVKWALRAMRLYRKARRIVRPFAPSARASASASSPAPAPKLFRHAKPAGSETERVAR